MENIITVKSVEKRFNTVAAIDKISFDVMEGEIFALLGPNGAGKTTMVRMMTGIIYPDFGEISFSLSEHKTQKLLSEQFGYLPEDRGLYKDVPILKTLIYMGIIRGMKKKAAYNKAMEWLERLELKDRSNEKLDALSKGNQQKIQFIASILHDPPILFLDEPFSGLDPLNQEIFVKLILEMKNSGKTILLSAHQMNLIEKLADRLFLIHKGRQVLSGTLEELFRSNNNTEKLILKLDKIANLSFLEDHKDIVSFHLENDNNIVLILKKIQSLNGLLAEISKNMNIISIKTETLSLHGIYIRKIEEALEKEN